MGIEAKNFVESDYKNEFHLKNGKSVKLILKYLTYRIPNSSKNIEPHTITLSLLRNSLLCQSTKLYIQPHPPLFNSLFVFYCVSDSTI